MSIIFWCLLWIIVSLFVAFLATFGLCKMAGKADEEMEKIYKTMEKEN